MPQPKKFTVRAAVIAINKILLESGDAIFVAPDQTRIDRASSDHGKLCVRGMFSGKWIRLKPEQQVGVWHGPTCIAIYRWVATNTVEVDR